VVFKKYFGFYFEKIFEEFFKNCSCPLAGTISVKSKRRDQDPADAG